MAGSLGNTYAIGQALHEVGLIPPNTSNVEVHIPADGAMVIRYDVFVTEEDIPKLERAFALVRERNR